MHTHSLYLSIISGQGVHIEGQRKFPNSPHHFDNSSVVVLDMLISTLVRSGIHTSRTVHEYPSRISLLANEGLDENLEVGMTLQHLHVHDPIVALQAIVGESLHLSFLARLHHGLKMIPHHVEDLRLSSLA